MRTPTYLPLCSIASWDPTGGAGAGADLRVFAAHGAHGTAVLAGLTAQTKASVTRVDPVPPAAVRDQLEALRRSQPPRGWKVGWIPHTGTARIVAQALAGVPAPVVLDPVLAPTAPGWTPDPDAPGALGELVGCATLVTPNWREACALAGHDEATAPDVVAESLLDLGAKAVLLKGLTRGRDVQDMLYERERDPVLYRSPRVHGGPFHGTGCALSSAILVHLAHGRSLAESVDRGRRYVQALLTLAHRMERWVLPHLAVRPS